MTVNHYLGDYHLTFTHNKGATDRSKAVGNVINDKADKLDRNATYVSAHDGPEGKVYLGTGDLAAMAAFEVTRLPGVKKVLDENGIEKDLYLEFGMQSPKGQKNTGGFHYTIHGGEHMDPFTPYHVVGLKKTRTAPYISLHEIVHAARGERGWSKIGNKFTRATDEVETSLETLAIMDPPTLDQLIRDIENGDRGASGYYFIFTDPAAAILYDRVLMTGDVNTSLSIEEAHKRTQDPAVKKEANVAFYRHWERAMGMVPPTRLPDNSARRARLHRSRASGRAVPQQRVVAVRVSSRPSRSKRLAQGAGERLYEALVGRKVVRIHATQGNGVTKADIARYLSSRLGAKAVWECQGCRKVRVA